MWVNNLKAKILTLLEDLWIALVYLKNKCRGLVFGLFENQAAQIQIPSLHLFSLSSPS